MMRVTLLAFVVLLCLPGAAGAAFQVPPYEPLKIEPKAPSYQVESDLSNIANLEQFGDLTPKQKEMLAGNGFFVSPASDEQLYFVYDRNDYLVVPNFIAADAVLQLYHIFYDYTLREIEAERLIPLCEKLTQHMLAQSVSMYQDSSSYPDDVRTAILKNVAYFGVAARLLRVEAEIPTAAKAMVAAELAKIAEHEGRQESAIFPFQEDYSQYVPRGHYTRSDALQHYFKAMMWYGRMPFPLEQGPKRAAYEQIRQSLLIIRMLYESGWNGNAAIEAWGRIYEPTTFYVEVADDFTPPEWLSAAEQVWGGIPDPVGLADVKALDRFRDLLMAMRSPRIATFPEGRMGLIGMPTGRQFRFMGQRDVPDSYVLQQLVASYVKGRTMPLGLDVMSALGSERAYDILKSVYGVASFADYGPQMTKLRAELAAKTGDDWRRNLYWGWVWVLGSLVEPFGEGHPSFMRCDAWLDKALNTALASWAEMRHDTILYVKQSYTAECGDGEPYEEPPVPKGYVEPVAETYHRMLWLTQATRKGLRDRDLLTPALDDAFGRMEDLLVFLELVSLKELANEPLTAAEYDQIRLLGSELESLTNLVNTAVGGTAGGLISEADEDMALVADVHTDFNSGTCLEEATGHANLIFVVVPIEGSLYLTRGAVFSYYEFTHPLADRLTDEAWQQMLEAGNAPAPPAWAASFLAGPKSELPVPKVPRHRGHGC